ncbi:MAG: acyltransferase [Lachnospiraceae bacterium]|nr:acyltransferase [Lachnospiraceae bacterium]
MGKTEMTVGSKEKPSGKIMSLQGVRAMAFLGIFSSHVGLSQLGPWGVSVFLILSGFLLAYTGYDKAWDQSFGGSARYSLEKIRKLYPLHVLTLLIALAVELWPMLSDHVWKDIAILGGKAFLNAALLHAWVPSAEVYFSLNGVSWYLSVCLFLYFIFPFVMKRLKRSDAKKLLMVAILVYLAQVFIAVLTRHVEIPHWRFYGFQKWLTYICPLFRLGDLVIGGCVGCVCARRMAEKVEMKRMTATILEVVVIFLVVLCQFLFVHQVRYFGTEWFRYSMLFAPTSVALVFLAAQGSGWISKVMCLKPLVYLGNLSGYAFLIHTVVIVAIGPLFAFLPVLVRAVSILAITIVLSQGYAMLAARGKNKTKGETN